MQNTSCMLWGYDHTLLHIFEIRPIFANIPELPGILVCDTNVHRGITAVPYIVLKCFNANVVRNISVPLLRGQLWAINSNTLNLFFFLWGNSVCASLLDPPQPSDLGFEVGNLSDEEKYRPHLQHVTPVSYNSDGQMNEQCRLFFLKLNPCVCKGAWAAPERPTDQPSIMNDIA